MEQTTCTPYFIHGKETADLLGVPYSPTLFETVVSAENPNRIIGFHQGHTFHTADKVEVSKQLTKFTIHFKNPRLHEVIIHAENEQVAIFLLDEMYNLDLIARMTREIVSMESVWESQD